MTCQAKIIASYLIIKGQKLQSLLRYLKCTFFEIFNLISINTARFKYIIIHLNEMKIKDFIFKRRPLPSQVSLIGKNEKFAENFHWKRRKCNPEKKQLKLCEMFRVLPNGGRCQNVPLLFSVRNLFPPCKIVTY